MYALEGVVEVIDSMNEIKTQIEKPGLNKKRADAFKIFSVNRVKVNDARLDSITSASEKISGPHNPEWKTGALLKAMEVREDKQKNACDVGYFKDSNKKIGDSKLTIFQIASMQHTGFRIPLKGRKGEKVRGFLAAHGIFPSKSRRYLVVKPRPFLFTTADRYENSRIDNQVVERDFNEWWVKI